MPHIPPLNTKDACARTGATRFALMRAHKAGALLAFRDNKTSGWLWDVDSLDAWSAQRAPTVHAQPSSSFSAALVDELRERAQRAEARAAQAESRLADLALELARRRARFWPFG